MRVADFIEVAQEARELERPRLELIDPSDLEGKAAPVREFLIDSWLPSGCVTSLYGPGGVGKSLLAQQTASALATGSPFFGIETSPSRVLALFAEDDDDELHRRQERINAAMGLRMAHLGNLRWKGLVGSDNRLASLLRGQPPLALDLFTSIEEAARRFKARLVILDNIAQLYSGDENDRASVTWFLNLIAGLALRLNAAVLLLGHPSKSSDFSGSTAWDANVRSRWTFNRKENGEGEAEQLTLRRDKANYAPPGEMHLQWQNGALICTDNQMLTYGQQLDAELRKGHVRQTFLDALDQLTTQGRNVSHAPQANNFAPFVIREAGLANGFSSTELRQAMNQLLGDQTIHANANFGTKPNRHPLTGLARCH